MPKQSLFEKTTIQADTEAALSVTEMERNKIIADLSKQQKRELMIAQAHEVAGQIRAVGMIRDYADVSGLMWLKQAKESKIYEGIPGIGTWEKFCNYLGLSRQHADDRLKNLAVLGEQLLLTCQQLSVGYRDLRRLRMAVSAGDLVIDAEYAVIGEERIPLTPDHTEDLQAAIEALLESRDKKIDDQQATIKAKDRILENKERLINKQEKALATLEQRAAAKGLSAEEEACIQQCENARITIDGFFAQFDPEINPLPDNHTPRMRAALMETLGYFRRVVDAAYDTAADLYGNPELDDEWVPPHLRPAEGDPAPDCGACEWHKAMSNPKKGVKIPGQHGKCTKPGGLCKPEADFSGAEE